MTLREKAKEIALYYAGYDTDYDKLADAIEAECRAFAERALRQIYEVDDNDQPGPWDDNDAAIAERKRARGSYRVKREFNPLETPSSILEKRYYREEFNKMIATILAAAEKGDE